MSQYPATYWGKTPTEVTVQSEVGREHIVQYRTYSIFTVFHSYAWSTPNT